MKGRIQKVTLVDPRPVSPPLPVREPIPPEPDTGLMEPETKLDFDLEELERKHQERKQAEHRDREHLEELVTGLRQLGQDLRRRQLDRLQEFQQAAVAVGLAAAERVIQEKLADGTFPIENIVRHLLSHMGPVPRVTILLHPEDRQLLERRLGGSLTDFFGDHVEFQTDPILVRGELRGETGEHNVLSRLEDHLEAIRRTLHGSVAPNAGPVMTQ